MDIKCSSCNRYLGKAVGTVVATLKCANSSCKEDVNVKIVNTESSSKDIHHKFEVKQ